MTTRRKESKAKDKPRQQRTNQHATADATVPTVAKERTPSGKNTKNNNVRYKPRGGVIDLHRHDEKERPSTQKEVYGLYKKQDVQIIIAALTTPRYRPFVTWKTLKSIQPKLFKNVNVLRIQYRAFQITAERKITPQFLQKYSAKIKRMKEIIKK